MPSTSILNLSILLSGFKIFEIVPLCIPGWPGICFVDQDWHQTQKSPCLSLQSAGSKNLSHAFFYTFIRGNHSCVILIFVLWFFKFKYILILNLNIFWLNVFPFFQILPDPLPTPTHLTLRSSQKTKSQNKNKNLPKPRKQNKTTATTHKQHSLKL